MKKEVYNDYAASALRSYFNQTAEEFDVSVASIYMAECETLRAFADDGDPEPSMIWEYLY